MQHFFPLLLSNAAPRLRMCVGVLGGGGGVRVGMRCCETDERSGILDMRPAASAELLALKHESWILGHSSNPV